ncbi:MAG: hypothetical protein EA338_04925 [Roseinatronobacter sp.]|nr:MAG: hypothetical protein EA338_04925 [Roseinatronobacter sp.]
MEILIDLTIAFGAIMAAAYCLLLSRRLRALTRLDGDVGKAIAVLSKQVDDLTKALRAAQQSNTSAGAALDQQITQATATARRLELLMAAAQSGQAAPAAQNRPMPTEPTGGFAPQLDLDAFTPLRQSTPRPDTDTRRRVMRTREQIGGNR